MKLIFPISFVVISLLLFIFLINPQYNDVKQLKADVSAYKGALDNSTELQGVRDSLVETYKNITKEDKERLEHFLPSSINNIELILEIEKIANTYGMPIKNIKFDTDILSGNDETELDTIVVPDDKIKNLPYGVFPMEFVVEGRYDTFMLFLNDLEHNLRLVDVKYVSFAVPSKDVATTEKINPDLFSYTLQVDTYWLK